MSQPVFAIAELGQGCYLINDRDRTVAIITSQGYIDWLLPSALQPGPLLTGIKKETHLSYTLGLKVMLTTPSPGTILQDFSYAIEHDGARLVLTGHGVTPDGRYTSDTTAVLTVDPASSNYQWALETTIACTSPTPLQLHSVEFNNVYPAKTGRCMLFAPQKEYSCTLVTDREGTIWRFPHQHMLHYGRKFAQLNFATGTIAGFFGDPAPAGCPVVEVQESPVEPDWAICDMYFDLHCMARVNATVQAGDAWTFTYLVKYLDAAAADRMVQAARPISITLDDWETHNYPRLELGMNSFERGCDLDRMDDCSGFRPRPPQRVWDREIGHQEKGSLRLTNATPEENVWSAEPPTQIPAETKLNITGLVKTQGVTGKGLTLRVRYHTFVWHPTPHVEWVATLESEPVTGTTDGWMKVTVPELTVPAEHFDYLVWLDVILDGKGVAWVTDVDVDLQPLTPEAPEMQEGGLARKSSVRARPRRLAGAGPVR